MAKGWQDQDAESHNLGATFLTIPDSLYSELLNYWLHKLDESGLKDRMWQEWSNERIEEFTIPDAQHLGFDTTAHPFLILVGGISIAFISLVCEKIQLAIINANEVTSEVGDISQRHQDNRQTERHLITSMCLTCQKKQRSIKKKRYGVTNGGY